VLLLELEVDRAREAEGVAFWDDEDAVRATALVGLFPLAVLFKLLRCLRFGPGTQLTGSKLEPCKTPTPTKPCKTTNAIFGESFENRWQAIRNLRVRLFSWRRDTISQTV
jgi:hypothetical protein